MADSHTDHGDGADFNEQYRTLVKEVFIGLARDALEQGADASARAQTYAALGKPDFTLAYLLACGLPDGEKRELLASAHERRAALTEERAREFDRRFHRPFPMLHNDAVRDRSAARQIRAGKAIRPGLGRAVPMV
ncbi:MAG: hypothetical protein ACHQ4H_00635 [Ktedonobacterales bacterium]